jgi:phospholipase C
MSQDNQDQGGRPVTRRQFIGAAAALAGSMGLASCGGGGASGSSSASTSSSGSASTTTAMTPPTLPDPAQSGIDHVVMVVMENRSFDHYLGWVPGVNGKQAGLSYVDAFGTTQNTFHLSANPQYGYQGCNFADPDHSYTGGRTQMNGGKMDGFLKTPDTNQTQGDLFPIGYYTDADLPFFAGCAKNWTICDSYHCGILAETYPNRFYLMSGQTDRLVNTSTTSTLPNVFANFTAKGLSTTYYFSDVPFTALYGSSLLSVSKPFASFLVDAAAGNLPAYSQIDPRFLGESPEGISGDDHPNSDIRNGQAFLNQVYNAVTSSPQWSKTLLIVVYDEWGGFFEHVVPTTRPVSAAESTLGNDGLLGFRVPFVLIGPRAKRGAVSSWAFDPSSIHKFLSWRFGIDPLGVRGDAADTNSIAYALDFVNPPDTTVPTAFDVPVGPFGGLCSDSLSSSLSSSSSSSGSPNTSTASGIPGISELSALASSLGFPTL